MLSKITKIITAAAVMAVANAITLQSWLGNTDCSGDVLLGITYEVSEPYLN